MLRQVSLPTQVKHENVVYMLQLLLQLLLLLQLMLMIPWMLMHQLLD